MKLNQIACSFLLGIISSYSYATVYNGMNIGTNQPLMYSILSNGTSFTNELNILNAKPNLDVSKLYVGGYAQGGMNFVNASQPTYFYSNNMTYSARDYLSLDRTALAFIGNFNSWATLYVEVGVMDIGEPYVSDVGLNQTYLLFGTRGYPLYGFAGYKNIDFGNFSSVNIFAQPVTRWDYAGTALTAGAGFHHQNYNVTLSALRSGTQGAEDYYGSGLWRVHNYPNYYTAQGQNFALNASYSLPLDRVNWTVGAGYMRGLWLGNPGNFFHNATIGAWDLNTQFHYERLTVLAEFVKSTPQTSSFGRFTPIRSDGIYLPTWDVGASYKLTHFILPSDSTVSIDYSGVVGNTSIAHVSQWVLGLDNAVMDHLNAGLEYVLISQSSGQDAMRSGLFYRAHDKVQVIRLDLTAFF